MNFHVLFLKNEYWGLGSGAGCAPCECDPLGSIDGSCDDNSGLCHCKRGVGGPRCDNCLPRFYGFSENGCLGMCENPLFNLT